MATGPWEIFKKRLSYLKKKIYDIWPRGPLGSIWKILKNTGSKARNSFINIKYKITTGHLGDLL